MCWDHPPDDRQSESTSERFGFQPQELMALEMFRSLVDDLFQLGTRRIDLVGRGEPLLNPAAVDMVSYAKSKGMLVLLCTNGSKLSEDKAESLVAAGLDRLNISLNAGTEDNYPNIHVTETPENYRRVKRNLSFITGLRAERGSSCPYVRLSFVVSAKNYFEIESMVRVTAEVGADEAMFTHAVVHEGTPDLAIDEDGYREMQAEIPAIRALASTLGVQTNLATFASTVPTYMKSHLEAPAVVPCYVGFYFTNILANGSVMPCCQCADPVDRVGEGKGFAEIWRSQEYREFRTAAKNLPVLNERLSSCECDRCMLRSRNLTMHNFLHPFSTIEPEDDEQLFAVRDLLRMKKTDRS
jgi:MoaA/NifB/PqqE/SkfB family radical SAM enzyme